MNSMKKIILFIQSVFAVLVINLLFSHISVAKTVTEKILWKAGEGNYKGYRIPSILVSSKGQILAFAEGRNDGGDSGDIDIVLKRSKDNGRTWSGETTIWNDSLNTCGNPCPVLDRQTGRIWLFMTWNLGSDHENEIIHKTSKSSRIPYVCYSDDEGQSWSKPEALTGTCKDPAWGWYATGPGTGIQLKNGEFKGRLVIPANHSYDDPNGKVRKGPYNYGAHVLMSDDHGKTWRLSAPIRPGCNESQVAELTDGTLLMNMRSYNGKSSRAISISRDGGETWSPISHDYQLVESMCQAGFINYGYYRGKELFLFSNPAVPTGRTHMTLKISMDNCQTWAASRLIYAGPSGYSCMARLPNNQVGLLFEKGVKSPYETISFLKTDLKKLFESIDI